MNNKIPAFIYVIKAIMFLVLMYSLLFLSNKITSVIYVIAVAFIACEFYAVNKYKIGGWNNLIFKVISRIITILPLIFICIRGLLLWWVLVIILLFETFVFLYNNFMQVKPKASKIVRGLYVLYNLTLYLSVISFLLRKISIGVYILFVASIVVAVYIITSSIFINNEEDVEVGGGAEKPSVDQEISTNSEDGFVE